MIITNETIIAVDPIETDYNSIEYVISVNKTWWLVWIRPGDEYQWLNLADNIDLAEKFDDEQTASEYLERLQNIIDGAAFGFVETELEHEGSKVIVAHSRNKEETWL